LPLPPQRHPPALRFGRTGGRDRPRAFPAVRVRRYGGRSGQRHHRLLPDPPHVLRRHPLRRRPLAELLGDADRIQLRQGQGRGRRRLRLLVSDVGHQRTLHADRLQVSIPQRRLQCGLLALLGLVRHGARHGSVPQPHRQRRLFGFRRHPRRRHQLRREKHGSQYRRQRHRPSQLAGVGDDLLVERFDRPALCVGRGVLDRRDFVRPGIADHERAERPRDTQRRSLLLESAVVRNGRLRERRGVVRRRSGADRARRQRLHLHAARLPGIRHAAQLAAPGL